MSNEFIASCFSGTYAESRQKFLRSVLSKGLRLSSFVLPDTRGALGEELAIDVAYLGPADATQLMIISSGTHGPEGFAGSACQLAFLEEDKFRTILNECKVALILIHSINPFGYSWLHRTNEDNVDVNRNAVVFPVKEDGRENYATIETLLLHDNWPASMHQKAELTAYCEANGGMASLPKVLHKGQYSHPDGLFYGGCKPSWSITIVRQILHEMTTAAREIVWIDVHTGLGSYGHAEKICPGRLQDLDFARTLWGSDVMVTSSWSSAPGGVSSSVIKLLYEVCPDARAAIMGLEFGTVPYEQVLECLVADAWLRRQRHASESVRTQISGMVRSAFFCDSPDWKGMIIGQARTIFLQSIMGLQELAAKRNR